MCVVLLCTMLVFLFSYFFPFFPLAHLSGKQKCLLPVGGRNLHLEKNNPKKKTPTFQAQLPLRFFCCILEKNWEVERDEKLRFVFHQSTSNSIDTFMLMQCKEGFRLMK